MPGLNAVDNGPTLVIKEINMYNNKLSKEI